MMTTRRVAVMLCAVGAAACAASTRSTASGPARWSGEFKPKSGFSSAVFAPATSAQAAGYGSVTLTPEEGATGRTRVDLSVTVPTADEKQLAWAVLSGRCGSPPAPVTGVAEFPSIDVSTNGGGSVRAVLPFGLDEHSTYHANVYNSSHAGNEGDVLMCANLEHTGGH